MTNRHYRSLIFLLRMQCMGKCRRAVHRMWSPKRAILALLAALLMGTWFSQEVVLWWQHASLHRATPPQFLAMAPCAMVGLLLLKLSPLLLRRDMAGVQWRGGDAGMLLGGPFLSRHVRFYKATGHLLSIFITAFFSTFFLLNYAASWLHAYWGAFFAISWIYLLYLLGAITITHLSQRAYDVCRITFGSLLLGLLAYCLTSGWHGPTELLSQQTWRGSLQALASLAATFPARIILSPFHFLASIFLANKTFWDFPIHLLIAGCGTLILFVLVLWWESYLNSRRDRQEQRQFALGRIARQSRTDGARTDGARQTRATSKLLGRLPWCAGLGPIVWRQLSAARHQALSLAGITAGSLALALWLVQASDRVPSQADFAAWLLFVFFTALILPGMLPYDFRSDYLRIPLLKTLPIHPASIALGQLVVPVAITTTLQSLLLLAWWLVNPRETWSLWIGPAFLLPVNVLFFALENTVFLLYPYHPGEFGFHATVGRVLKGAARIVLFAAAAFASVAFAYVTLWLIACFHMDTTAGTWQRMALFLWWVIGGWLLLATAAASMVSLLCVVYAYYDPGVDSPLRNA